MYFYIASVAHTDGTTTRRRIAADDLAEARKIATWLAANIDDDYTSVEVWKD